MVDGHVDRTDGRAYLNCTTLNPQPLCPSQNVTVFRPPFDCCIIEQLPVPVMASELGGFVGAAALANAKATRRLNGRSHAVGPELGP